MRKFLTALGVAAFLSVSAWGTAFATVVTNTTDQLFNAVGETSSTLTVAANTQLTIFVSGVYENINTLVLQKEAGSPGSGVFRNVLTVTTGTANSRIVTGFLNGPNRNGYRLNMTATGTGAINGFLSDHPVTPRTWVTNATQIVRFDDFEITGVASATVLDANLYVVAVGTNGNSEVSALIDVSNREGGVFQTNSDTDDEMACVSYIDNASHGALVSDGWTVVEARVQISGLAGLNSVGLTDTVCTDTVPYFSITAGTVVANGATASIVAAVQSEDATALTSWQAVSAISNTEGSNAEEVVLATAVAAVYEVVRIEVDSAGNAYWYINGVFVHAEPLAVLTTSEIVPMVMSAAVALTTTTQTQTIDYIMFVKPRPSLSST